MTDVRTTLSGISDQLHDMSSRIERWQRAHDELHERAITREHGEQVDVARALAALTARLDAAASPVRQAERLATLETTVEAHGAWITKTDDRLGHLKSAVELIATAAVGGLVGFIGQLAQLAHGLAPHAGAK